MGVLDWLAYVLTNRPAWRLYRELYKGMESGSVLMALYPGGASYRVTVVGVQSKPQRRKCVLGVTEAGLATYPFNQEMAVDFICAPDELRWFGRPEKYRYGVNEMVIHAEIAGRWYVTRLWLERPRMQQLVRALKAITTPEQVTAYRRRRPYIHFGPVDAEPATQELTGEWTLEPPITLYLTPAFLVILDGFTVLRTVALADIQRIQALHRMDAPEAYGVVRFQVEGEQMAFALPEHEALAGALAEAAKRTLEAPVFRKRKSKDDYYDDEDEDEE